MEITLSVNQAATITAIAALERDDISSVLDKIIEVYTIEEHKLNGILECDHCGHCMSDKSLEEFLDCDWKEFEEEHPDDK